MFFFHRDNDAFATKEIAASTAQLVSASRVKAPSNSTNKQPLEAASKKGLYQLQHKISLFCRRLLFLFLIIYLNV